MAHLPHHLEGMRAALVDKPRGVGYGPAQPTDPFRARKGIDPFGRSEKLAPQRAAAAARRKLAVEDRSEPAMPTPNLLFLFTDEQRYDTMAAYGNRKIEMPNLDRLAAQSCLFERAYVTQPICTPSRSSLLTGLYPHTNGCVRNNVPLGAETPCLPELLPPRRYATAYHGKWHLGDEIFAQHGFDEWRSIEDGYARYYSEGRDRNARSTYHHWLIERGVQPGDGSAFNRGETARLPEELTKPAYLGDEACRFLHQVGTQPFVLYVNFLEPHMPFFGPRDDQYDPAEIDLPPNFENPPGEDVHLNARLLHARYRQDGMDGMPLKTEADWRRLIANYWGLCSLVDTHVGRILDTLEQRGLAENTIVVYTSDHGDMMGSHRLVAKSLMYEEAVRVPMFIRLPGQTAGRRVARPVSQIDMVPTLLDLMGAERPGHLEGQSLRPVLEGGPEPERDVIVEWTARGRAGEGAARKGDPDEVLYGLATRRDAAAAHADPRRTLVTPDNWKLVCSPDLGQHELYDLNSDPYETTNLAGHADQKPRMREMRDRIRAWQERTGDAVELPEV